MFVMVKCCVLFEVRTLNIKYYSDELRLQSVKLLVRHVGLPHIADDDEVQARNIFLHILYFGL
jgi:hypothetical protein